MISMTVPQYRRRECTINGEVVRLRWSYRRDVLVALLLSHPDYYVSRAELIASVFSEPDLQPDYAADVIRQGIHFLRRWGVTIESRLGFGWRIPRHAREALPVRAAA